MEMEIKITRSIVNREKAAQRIMSDVASRLRFSLP